MTVQTASAKFTRRHLTAKVLTDILAKHEGFAVHGNGKHIYVYAGDPHGAYVPGSWERTETVLADLKAGLAHFTNLKVYSGGSLIHLDFSGIVIEPSRLNNCD